MARDMIHYMVKNVLIKDGQLLPIRFRLHTEGFSSLLTLRLNGRLRLKKIIDGLLLKSKPLADVHWSSRCSTRLDNMKCILIIWT